MDLLVADVTAEQQLVSGQRLAVCTALGAEETDVGGMVLATAVGATRDVDAHTAHLGQALFLQLLADRLGQTARLCHGDVARVGTRAGHHVTGKFGTGARHADLVETVVERTQLVFRQIAEHHVLAVRQANVGAELALDTGKVTELIRRDVAERGVGHRRDGSLGGATDDAGLFPAHEGIRRTQVDPHSLTHGRDFACRCHAGGSIARGDDLGRNATGPRRRCGKRVAQLNHAAAHLVDAELVDHPLESCTQLVLAIAGLVEHAQDRLDRRQQFFLRREVLESECGMRCGPETTGDVHAEALFDGAVLALAVHGHDTHVVEHRLAAVGGATGEVHLELARQALAERVAHEVAVNSFGPRGDVDLLVRAGAGKMARHHVAHRVAARLTRGEADCGETTQHVGNATQFDEVELDVLARGDVSPSARELGGEFAHELELLGGDGSRRQLDADHLVGAALTLAVHAVVQAHHTEHVLGHLSGQVLRNGHFEAFDVAHLLGIEITGLGRGGNGNHDDSLSVSF